MNKELFLRACGGWVITLVVVGCTTAMLVGPSPVLSRTSTAKDWEPVVWLCARVS